MIKKQGVQIEFYFICNPPVYKQSKRLLFIILKIQEKDTMQSNPCDPCNPPVVKWVNPQPQPQPAQIWNPCDPCAPVMYNPCPPTQPAQLRGGKDFFDIQVTENKKGNGATGPTVPLNNFCGGRKAILVVNVADFDETTSKKNLS